MLPRTGKAETSAGNDGENTILFEKKTISFCGFDHGQVSATKKFCC